MQNVIVLGGSYGGAHAAQVLSQSLGSDFRIIMVDRNSHAHHLYVLPRIGVLNGHEHKAFVPYTRVFDSPSTSTSDASTSNPPTKSRHLVLQAQVLSLSTHSVTLDRAFPEHGFTNPTIPFAYCIYALGSRMPIPIDLWSHDPNTVASQPGKTALPGECAGAVEGRCCQSEGKCKSDYDGSKVQAIEWLKRCQERIRRAGSVLCVGGGALGIQFATDIKSLYPEKQVTLLHSRHRLLPRFDYEMHTEILKTMEDLGVNLVLGERLDLESTRPEKLKFNLRRQRVVKTMSGRDVAADLMLLCTGQTPNTEFIARMSPESIDPETKLAYVLPTLQLGIRPPMEEIDDVNFDALDLEDVVPTEEPLPPTPYPHIFVIGDAADAFGAIKAGHTAYWQGEVAARNILRMAERETCSCSSPGLENEPLVLERYEPGPPGIKVSLGLGSKSLYQIDGVVGRKDRPDPDDLDAGLIWSFFGWPQSVSDEDMHQ